LDFLQLSISQYRGPRCRHICEGCDSIRRLILLNKANNRVGDDNDGDDNRVNR